MTRYPIYSANLSELSCSIPNSYNRNSNIYIRIKWPHHLQYLSSLLFMSAYCLGSSPSSAANNPVLAFRLSSSSDQRMNIQRRYYQGRYNFVTLCWATSQKHAKKDSGHNTGHIAKNMWGGTLNSTNIRPKLINYQPLDIRTKQIR